MCCDGSLFGRVDLEPDEVQSARKHRLRVLANAKGFEQPCSALALFGSERRCAIYDERPISCRRFVCRLYERHEREGGPIEERLAVVRRVRALAARLETSGLAPADFQGNSQTRPSGHDPELVQAYRELMQNLEEHFARGIGLASRATLV
jgi:Fe-S-cluster containining protein